MKSDYHYFALYKPYGMLSQFSPAGDKPTLKNAGAFPSGVYPIGRLDADSEGLLLLTDDPRVNHRLLNPEFAHRRTYLVQVEGLAGADACGKLEAGVHFAVNGIKQFARAAQAIPSEKPAWLGERIPPVRFRKTVPDSWIRLVLTEGKNRQVRKMTAAAGYPTLRLVRVAIEDIALEGMQPGELREYSRNEWMHALKLDKSVNR